MLLAHTAWKIDTLVPLGVIVVILAVSIVASLLRPRRELMCGTPATSAMSVPPGSWPARWAALSVTQ